MAASSSRDSTAMKTLAFITTLFLPGTSVAVRQTPSNWVTLLADLQQFQTIFSMSLFNWQLSNSGASGGPVVSSYFWIYWAVTVPLTIVVAISWRLWWGWEKRHYDRDVHLEIESIEAPAYLNSDAEKLSNQSQGVPGSRSLRNGWQSLRRRGGTRISS